MANFIVDFLFGPEKEEEEGKITFGAVKGDVLPKFDGGGKAGMTGLFEAARKPVSEMTEDEYDAALREKLTEAKFNRPITDEGDWGRSMSRSGINARNLAMLALDRGVPMYQPAGPDRTYTDQQYLDTLAQQPPTNKLFTPEEDALARQQFAQRMAMFKNQMAGFNKLYPPVNAMTRSPYDALVFGPANNPASFNAGPSQGEVNTFLPSNRFQARRIGR